MYICINVYILYKYKFGAFIHKFYHYITAVLLSLSKSTVLVFYFSPESFR